MPKAKKPVRRASATRKGSRIPLNTDARKMLELHLAAEAAKKAWSDALEPEKANAKATLTEREFNKWEPSTKVAALHARFDKADKAAKDYANRLAIRYGGWWHSGQKDRKSVWDTGTPVHLEDIIACAIAGFHSMPAERVTASGLRRLIAPNVFRF